jgi:hypothetical protein
MSTMMKIHRQPPRVLAFSLAAACLAASTFATAMPPGPPGPPAAPLPSAEELATIPSLSTQQQIELRKVLLERRDALDATREKTHETMEAQRKRERADVERIDEQSSERLRKLLGDDGFRRYAEWQLGQRGPRGIDGPRRDDDQRGPHHGAPDARPGPPGAPAGAGTPDASGAGP